MIAYRIKNKIVLRRSKPWPMGGRPSIRQSGDERTHAVGFAMPDPDHGYRDFDGRRAGFAFPRRPKA